VVWSVSPAWEVVELTLGARSWSSTLPIWERQSWFLQDKCLAVFDLPPTQIACLFSEASTVDIKRITIRDINDGYLERIYMDINGYLIWVPFLGYVLNSNPNSQKRSFHILSCPQAVYPFLSFSYRLLSLGANSQMGGNNRVNQDCGKD
jgi:hypothetical protein